MARAAVERAPIAGQTVAQRFEAKYLLNPVQHAAVQDYVEGYTRPDPYGAVYPVTSVYFDNGAWTSFRSSLYGEKNRFKLRVRTYAEAAGTPYFCEVKQRIGRVITKQRAAFPGVDEAEPGWEALIGSQRLSYPERASERDAFEVFESLRHRLGARPRIGVRYVREAYESAVDEPVRVTFDSELSYCRSEETLAPLWAGVSSWHLVDGAATVLEVKFTDAFPYWIRRLIDRFELERISLAKYVACVKAMARDGALFGSEEDALPTWAH